MAADTFAFAALLHDCIQYFGGRKGEFARAIGVRGPDISRFLAGNKPTIKTVLRVALLCRMKPGPLLAAAGYADIHDLNLHLYGAAATPKKQDDVSALDREVLKVWHRLPKVDQRALLILARHTTPLADRKPARTRNKVAATSPDRRKRKPAA